MAITKNSGRILGLLFLIVMILGGLGISYRGLAEIKIEDVSFLSNIAENVNTMYVAIALDMLSNVFIVFIAFFVYRLVKKNKLPFTKVYLGIALLNFTVIIISNLIHSWLLSMSFEFESTTMAVNQDDIATAKILYNSFFSAHFLTLILSSVANCFLFYFLFKVQVMAKWLAVWGIAASVIVSIGGLLQLLNIEVSFLLFAQNGIFMLVFILWMLIFGFKIKDSY